MRDVIVGHTYKKQNNSAAVIIFSIICAAALVIAVRFIESGGTQAKTEEKPAEAVKAEIKKEKPMVSDIRVSGISVIEKLTCKGIEGNLPVEITSAFSGGERVFFYTKLMPHNAPAQLKHVWISPNGRISSAIDMQAVNKPSNLWSYISLPPESSGTWTVQVRQGEKVIDEAVFEVGSE